jgi:hypothetical protein
VFHSASFLLLVSIKSRCCFVQAHMHRKSREAGNSPVPFAPAAVRCIVEDLRANLLLRVNLEHEPEISPNENVSQFII